MFELSVIVICLILNAILSCVEMAFVTVSRPHLKKLSEGGDKLAQKIINLKNNPERVLSVLQIGITLVGAISAAVGGAGAEENLSPFIQKFFSIEEELAESLSIVAIVLPITFFSVVIGELVPKALALKYPIRFARFGAMFLEALDKAFAPVVFLLEASTKLLTKVLFKNMAGENAYEASQTVELEELSDLNKQYVLNLVQVDKRTAKDIMLPWKLVNKIEASAHPHDVLDLIKSSGHTRLPVVEEDFPIGILHSKEFIADAEISKIDWLQLVRPAIFINPDEPILNSLKKLQARKNHMAIVKSEQNILGIITLEDIFEEVVGDIYDEDDNPRVLLSANSKIRTMNLKK